MPESKKNTASNIIVKHRKVSWFGPVSKQNSLGVCTLFEKNGESRPGRGEKGRRKGSKRGIDWIEDRRRDIGRRRGEKRKRERWREGER